MIATGPVFAADIPSAVTREECERLSILAHGRMVLELGAYLGRSTVALASTAERVHSVDWHRGDGHTGHTEPGNGTVHEYLRNLERYGVADRVVTHIGRFEDVLPVLSCRFSVVFLDGMHDVASVQRDYLAAVRLLAAGGAMAFHDYGASNELFGVTEVVDALKLPVTRAGNLAVVYP
jgi:predicted O-methyltransferase YrrM